MVEKGRLERVLAMMEERGWTFRRCMEDDCESIDFEYRGVSYHIWEFHDEEWGVETNVRHGGGMEEITGDYETKLLEIMEDWK
ncbi:MAG: kinase [Lachnospiraceae bacterium]|jgi:hypothetical protein|nr:kinase [Lachnospiraceae bacterium]MCI9600046.1 kinase [Lachnospiraceae bacterium]